MAKKKYTVKASAHPVVTLNSKGDVVGIETVARGGTVTLEEGDAKRLVDTGGLVLASDADGSEEPAPVPSTAPSGPGSLSGQTADAGLVDPDRSGDQSKAPGEDAVEENPAVQGPSTGAPTVTPAVIDTYNGMTYPDLVATAKKNDVDHKGSADDIRARLVEKAQASAS